MKRFLLPLAATLATVVIACAVVEAMALGYLLATEGHYIPARTRFASRTNTFVAGLGRDGDCTYVDSVYPHPYLGFVHHGNPPCGLVGINNVGLWGPDFPSVHMADYFVILVAGGSVAQQFALPVGNGPPYLQQMLNDGYVSPTNKPFLVLDGGDGAWKQPQQAIQFLLYADAVDAVITLDGFNEHYMLPSTRRFEYPASTFAQINPLTAASFGDIVAQWIVGSVRDAATRNPVLSRSQAAYTLIAAAQDYLARRAADRPKPQTTVESMFALPSDWSPAQREAWSLEQYRKYIRAMQAVASIYHVRTAFFLQPVPALDKTLSADEQRVVGDLRYGDLYRRMTDNLVALNAEGIPVVSLLDVFKSRADTLYADPIHAVQQPGNVSPGYELMATRIVEELARRWSLKRR